MQKEFWIGKEVGKREEANARAVEGWRIKSGFEISDEYGVIKSITKDGRVRVELDLDTFKELFMIGERHRFIVDIILNLPNEERKKVPFRVMKAIEAMMQHGEIATMCWHIIRAECLFDYRNKKEP